jgi:hypothetical protein
LLTPGQGSLQITLGATASDIAFADPPPTNFEIAAIVDGIGVARYGSLAGRAHAEARSAPAGPYLAGGQVSVIPGYTDGAEVRSDTLAPGTPVTLTFRMTLAATTIHFVDGSIFDPQGTGAAVRYEVAVSDLDNLAQPSTEGSLVINSRGFEETSRLLELDTAIGHRVELVADLAVNAGVRVDYPFLGVSKGTATALAEQTGELFHEPSGDVRLATESGHNYTVPEPDPVALLLASLPVLLLLRLASGAERRVDGLTRTRPIDNLRTAPGTRIVAVRKREVTVRGSIFR